MKRGALDYLVKPFAMAEVQALVTKALRVRALEQEVSTLRREVGARIVPGDRLVGKSPALLEVFKTVGRVANRNVAVLITGESGTGKELVARAIHAASPRAGAPFVAVNTAAIPRELLESELFGHERGAFTGAIAPRMGRFREASGGTLFLDEIGDMPVDLQAKLLRVLQSSEVTAVGARRAERVDVRIVAATHRDLDAAVAGGRFREDLLYRLRVVPIHVPPLRERREDIPVLVAHFVKKHAAKLGRRIERVPDRLMSALTAYAWPGNVRELEHTVERAMIVSEGPELATIEWLTRPDAVAPTSAPGTLEDVERAHIIAVLESTSWRVSGQRGAAEILGMRPTTLEYRMKKLKITRPR
jgi:DNA-binding NtrC family response regulator